MSSSFSLREGELEFIFPTNMQVWRVDNSPHYRKHLTSWKAVDFVLTHSECEQSWWVEVKDYSRFQRSKSIDLVEEIKQKVAGTAITAVATQFRASNPEDIAHAAKATTSRQMCFILQLEQPKHRSKMFPKAIGQQDLREKLRKELRFITTTVVETSVAAADHRVPWINVSRRVD